MQSWAEVDKWVACLRPHVFIYGWTDIWIGDCWPRLLDTPLYQLSMNQKKEPCCMLIINKYKHFFNITAFKQTFTFRSTPRLIHILTWPSTAPDKRNWPSSNIILLVQSWLVLEHLHCIQRGLGLLQPFLRKGKTFPLLWERAAAASMLGFTYWHISLNTYITGNCYLFLVW